MHEGGIKPSLLDDICLSVMEHSFARLVFFCVSLLVTLRLLEQSHSHYAVLQSSCSLALIRHGAGS